MSNIVLVASKRPSRPTRLDGNRVGVSLRCFYARARDSCLQSAQALSFDAQSSLGCKLSETNQSRCDAYHVALEITCYLVQSCCASGSLCTHTFGAKDFPNGCTRSGQRSVRNLKSPAKPYVAMCSGGEGGIRTHGADNVWRGARKCPLLASYGAVASSAKSDSVIRPESTSFSRRRPWSTSNASTRMPALRLSRYRRWRADISATRLATRVRLARLARGLRVSHTICT